MDIVEQFPDDFDIEENPIEYKKSRLSIHVPFIIQMIAKLEGTEFEKIWNTMHNCIVSDKKM